jgi:hypothetical protein
MPIPRPSGGQTLGILLANPAELPRAIRYARAAQEAGLTVRIFVTFEAVSILSAPAVDELTAAAEVIACAQTAHAQGIKARPGVVLGSQFDHAEIAGAADRFLALT